MQNNWSLHLVDVEENNTTLPVIVHITLAVCQQPVFCIQCEKGKLLGKFWRCIMAGCCIFLQRAPPRLAGQRKKRTLLVWKVYKRALRAGATGSQRCQRGSNMHEGGWCCDGWWGSWWEGGRREKTHLQLWAQREEQELRSAKTRGSVLWRKDESRTGNFSMEVWGRSELWSFMYQGLHRALIWEAEAEKVPVWRCWQFQGPSSRRASDDSHSDWKKQQQRELRRQIKSSGETHWAWADGETFREKQLSFGLGPEGAYGWIWVTSASSWACVYRWASPERRCPLRREEGRRPRAEPFGAHRKLEKNEGMLFSCSSMGFVVNKSF